MKGLVPSVRHCLVAVAMLRAFPSCILKSCLAAHNLSCPVAVKIITVSHQTFDWPILVYVQSFQYMLGQLCPGKSMGSVERSAKLQQKSRHSVLLATFSKWQHNWIRTTKPLCAWLMTGKKDSATGSVLPCSARFVVYKYEDQIRSLCNYSPVWIRGSTNLRCISVIDHAKCEQHRASMEQLRGAIVH